MSEYPPDETLAEPPPEPYVEDTPVVEPQPPVESVAPPPEDPAPVSAPLEPPPAPAPPPAPDPSGYSESWGTVEAGWAAETDANEVPTQTANWAPGAGSGCCGFEGARTVVSAATGQDVDAAELVARGAEQGWLSYDEAGEAVGFRNEDLGPALAGFGVESREFGGPGAPQVGEADAWRAMNDAVASDRRVMVGLEDGRLDTVTGVDYTRGTMTVSPAATGGLLELPLDPLAESWRASNFSITYADSSDGGFALLGTNLAPELEAAPGTGAVVDMNELYHSELTGDATAGSNLLVYPASEPGPDPAPSAPGGWVSYDADTGPLGFELGATADDLSAANRGEPGAVVTHEFPRVLTEGGWEAMAYLLETDANLRAVEPLLRPIGER